MIFCVQRHSEIQLINTTGKALLHMMFLKNRTRRGCSLRIIWLISKTIFKARSQIFSQTRCTFLLLSFFFLFSSENLV